MPRPSWHHYPINTIMEFLITGNILNSLWTLLLGRTVFQSILFSDPCNLSPFLKARYRGAWRHGTAPESYLGSGRLESRPEYRSLFWSSSWLASVAPDKWRDRISTTSLQLPSNSLPIYYSSIILPFADVQSSYWQQRKVPRTHTHSRQGTTWHIHTK
jgi:hypothetical protein